MGIKQTSSRGDEILDRDMMKKTADCLNRYVGSFMVIDEFLNTVC